MDCPTGDLNIGWGIMLSLVSPKLWEKNVFTVSEQECLLSGIRENRKSSGPCQVEMEPREAN